MRFFPLALAASTVNLAVAQVSTALCGGKSYTYEELAGYGFVPNNGRDKYGDTLGGFGSAIALDRSKWEKNKDGSYKGVLYALPDRGWNTQGTINYQPRIHKFGITFTPKPSATVAAPSGPNLVFTYQDTTLLYGPDGTTPCTGLDADPTGHISYPGFPPLPGATFLGDGWGNGDTIQRAITIDGGGLALGNDGTFWISDEYGPYVYQFKPNGKMITAIRPVDAIIPMRNGTESFSANSPYLFPGPPGFGNGVIPADNPTGRDNNKGFEGMTLSGDGKTLFVALQAADNQEGGLKATGRRYIRLLKYDITVSSSPRFAREYVVPLPFQNAAHTKVAAESEIFHIQDGSFFILARDSSAGHGQASPTSVYRHIDIFNIDLATNIKGQYDCSTCAIADANGVLNTGITPAEYCSFIDFNINAQLNRFGVHNGGVQDQFLLNEKWESIGMVPVDGKHGDDDEWFVFSLSDNDFITQNGFLNFGQSPYKDASGFNLDNQALVFKIKLPIHSAPFPV